MKNVLKFIAIAIVLGSQHAQANLNMPEYINEANKITTTNAPLAAFVSKFEKSLGRNVKCISNLAETTIFDLDIEATHSAAEFGYAVEVLCVSQASKKILKVISVKGSIFNLTSFSVDSIEIRNPSADSML